MGATLHKLPLFRAQKVLSGGALASKGSRSRNIPKLMFLDSLDTTPMNPASPYVYVDAAVTRSSWEPFQDVVLNVARRSSYH